MKLLLDAGSGGKASMRLIHDIFLKHFDNEILRQMDDAAFLKIHSPIAMSTDSYTVSPLFFSGANIGKLAVHGTVNDVAMLGAKPKYLSCAFILEEGFELEELEKIVESMAEAVHEAGVYIVTGDTKVVPKGACDKIFINTTGIGEIIPPTCSLGSPSGHKAQVGDSILLSGTMGDHGLTIMAAREDLSFVTGVESDSACLNHMIVRLMEEVGDVHVLRDPTRGGVATTVNEIAEQSSVRCTLFEDRLPIKENVRSGASVLGLDPLYLANEGKLLCFVPKEKEELALKIMREDKRGRDAVCIGEVSAFPLQKPHISTDSATETSATFSSQTPKSGQVILQTRMGGRRLLNMLEGAALPRIC